MYLTMLGEKQKNLFLELAVELVEVDGEYSEAEKEMIKLYCQEMGIQFNEKSEKKATENIIEEMALICTAIEKKIIVFEIIGLAMSDSKFEDAERTLINNISKIFGFNEDFVASCENILREYLLFQTKINNVIFN